MYSSHPHLFQVCWNNCTRSRVASATESSPDARGDTSTDAISNIQYKCSEQGWLQSFARSREATRCRERYVTHLELGKDQFWNHDKRHRVNEAQSSREWDDEEGKEPKSGYPRDAGYPVGDVVLGIHRDLTVCSN